MATPRNIIHRAFHLAGIYAPQGETPTDEEVRDAIDTLNDILNQWSIGRLEAHDFQPINHPLDINRHAYTIGDGDAADANGVGTCAASATSFTIDGALASASVATFDIPRQIAFVCSGDESSNVFLVTGTNERGETLAERVPGANAATAYGSLAFKTVTAITMTATADAVTAGTCSLIDTEAPFRVMDAQYGSGTTDTDLEIWDREKYKQQTAKRTTATTPTAVYYERQSRSGMLYLYQAPNAASKTLAMDLWQPLPQYSISTIDTTITNMPKEYEPAMKYALAEALCPEYGRPVPENVSIWLSRSTRVIRMLHATHPADRKRTPPVESVDSQPAANQQ